MSSWKNNVNIFLLLLSPILHQYKFIIPGVSIGEFFLFILLLLNIKHLRIEKKIIITLFPLFLFIFYCLFISLIHNYYDLNFSYISLIVGLTRYSFYICMMIIIVNCNILKEDMFIKTYKYIGLIATVYIFIQTIAFYTVGIVLPWKFPFLTVYAQGYDQIDFSSSFATLYRPYSFFLEPGYYAQYLIPIFVITIFNIKSRKDKILVSLYTVGFFASTSGQGIIIGTSVWLIIIGKYFIKNNYGVTIKKVFLMLMSPLIILAGTRYIYNNEVINRSILRLFVGDQSSINSRLTSPLTLYHSLPLYKRIIGIGYNNVEAFFGKIAISNSVIYILLVSGIIGLALIALYMILLYVSVRKNFMLKILFFIFFTLLFVTGIFTSLTGMFYQCILLSTIGSIQLNKEKFYEKKQY
ncbi:hypothetical protein [Enterococcus faecium]|uniref:hypothetical protein n=1 Tax=Enterococcus faecium TaxID=1352 RepID=UPI00028278BC|nr:hypothetical protein [Enterococcus faecium]EGP4763261.1 hypothetical protein [Enterococcus faecium]EJY48077.1 hypothetical protein HMPREF1347_02275 [Enterococcus faecium 504]EME7135924.1 hypothetical protein [Enterococcus faecium]